MTKMDSKDDQINERFLKESQDTWNSFKLKVMALGKAVQQPYEARTVKVGVQGLISLMEDGDLLLEFLRKAVLETTGESLEEYTARLRRETK